MRVLITGMSGTGKSAVVSELRRRGFDAHDADDDGYTEPDANGVWHWRMREVARLLSGAGTDLVFFAGCSEEQAQFRWDLQVLLTVPEHVMVERLARRTSNAYGRSVEERQRALADLRGVEPLLRRSADVVIETMRPLEQVVDRVLRAAEELEVGAA
jgi:dephospho-CoA kinase